MSAADLRSTAPAAANELARPVSREEYNYEHFRPALLLKDMRLTVRPKGPTPGEPAPDFTLADTDGNSWTLGALRDEPVVLVFGSGS